MTKKPIVYSCSGCSSAAQMANYIALQIDRKKLAEMSCIAGVGGNVRPLVHKAQSAEFILTIDGCALKCAQACLANHSIQPQMSIVLSDLKVQKKLHEDFSLSEATKILSEIESELITKVGCTGAEEK